MTTENIIVIGGGVMGLSCAWRLAQRGANVSLYEKDVCGCGASSASMGVLNPPTPLSHNPLQIIHRRSLKMFPSFIEELEQDSGVGVNFTRCGALEIIPSETQLERAQREVQFTKDNCNTVPNLPSLELLNREQILELEPNVITTDFGAIYTPSSAKVDVDPFVLALKTACLKRGVKIFEHTPVSKLEIQNDKVIGVVVNGELIESDIVLTATGVWTNDLDSKVNEYVKVTPVRGQAVLTKFAGLKHIIKWQKGYLVPYPEDTVALGGTTEKKAGFAEDCTVDGICSVLDRAKTVFPPIASAPILKFWAGLRPAPSDRRPFMGEMPNIKGLFMCSGHYKIGFSLTPISSDFISRIIYNEIEQEEIEHFIPRVQ